MSGPVTGIPLLDWFLALLGQYGYSIVFGSTVLENLFVVGSLTPGETIVMAAAFVSTQTEQMSPLTVWVLSVVGTVTGSNVSYFLGRRGGRPALAKYGGRFRIGESRIREAELYFEAHGSKTVLLSRFAAGFKNFVPMIAGVSHMRVWVFEAYVVIGAIIYTTIMVAVGVLLGENFEYALTVVARLGYVGLVLFLVVIGLAVFARRVLTRKRVARAEERLAEESGPGQEIAPMPAAGTPVGDVRLDEPREEE